MEPQARARVVPEERPMCPEGGVLSAYLDGELEDPWRSSVEAHIALCRACASTIERLRAVRERLAREEEPDLVDAMARVRNSLVSRLPVPSRRWRSVVIPAPIAALAACLVLLLGGGLVLSALRPWETSTVRFTSSPTGIRQFEIKGNPEDVRKILAALNTDAVDSVITLDIPSDFRLAPFGEPELFPAVQRSPE
jgi:anti-sigma factor RsiW